MDTKFARVDLLQVSSISGCPLQLLSASKKKPHQSLCIGDDSGSVSCFHQKKGELQNVFKTPTLSHPTLSLCLVPAVPGTKKKDRLFFPSGVTIFGISKKGKEFFKFTTELADPIRFLHVEEPKMWTAGEFVFNSFLETKDVGFYMCKDKINTMLAERFISDAEPNCVLGCHDRYVRVLQGKYVHYELSVSVPVTALEKFSSRSLQDIMTRGSSIRECLFGSENGVIGQLLMEPTTISQGWTMGNADKLGGISALVSANVLDSGMKDVVVGRDDGYVQIYSIDARGKGEIAFSRCVGESISAIKTGRVMNTSFDELICASYSGKLISFTTQPQSEVAASELPSVQKAAITIASAPKKETKEVKEAAIVVKEAAAAARETVQAREAKIRALRQEIDSLKTDIDTKRLKFKSISEESIAVASRYKIKHKFILLPEDAAHLLSLEIEIPIDTVALHSDADLQLLDAGVAVPSISPPDPQNNSLFLCTLRLQEPVTRLELKLRIPEGQVGSLTAFVIPRISPKTTQSISLSIKPLALFERIPSQEPLTRPMNELKLSGQFSLLDAHAWVSMCLPEVPAKVTNEEEAVVWFRSTFTGSIVIARYASKEASFKCDSPAPLDIIKDIVTREATARKQSVNISYTANDDTIAHFFNLIDPLMQKEKELTSKVAILDALKEVSMVSDGDDGPVLCEEDMNTLANADALRAQHKLQPKKLEFLHSIAINVFLSRHKFRGVNAKNRLPGLTRILQEYDKAALIQFILSNQ